LARLHVHRIISECSRVGTQAGPHSACRGDAAAAPPSTAVAVKINMMTSQTTVRTAGLLPAIGSYWGFGASPRIGSVGAPTSSGALRVVGRVAVSRVPRRAAPVARTTGGPPRMAAGPRRQRAPPMTSRPTAPRPRPGLVAALPCARPSLDAERLGP